MSGPKVLRSDEDSAWRGFIAAAPLFAGEPIADARPGPDPPDVLCEAASGNIIGVELTKWLAAKEVKEGADKAGLEKSYLRIIESEKEPRPEHIGSVRLYTKSSLRIKGQDEFAFRSQLFQLLNTENAKPAPSMPSPSLPIPAGYWSTVRHWDTLQGGQISDFAGFSMLEKYLSHVFILPRKLFPEIPEFPAPSVGIPWVDFQLLGGAYSHELMVQGAIDSILAKVEKYKLKDPRATCSLNEFDLLSYYCDEAVRYNPPAGTAGFGFEQVAVEVRENLTTIPAAVFDKIFLFNPYEDEKALQVYP
jgi:hypothetical protein